MTVFKSVGDAVQFPPRQPVDTVDKAVETGPEVGDLEHPAEDDGSVHVADAESKNGEKSYKHRTDENSNLKVEEINVLFVNS